MKRTANLLLGLALLGTATGCYCTPYPGGGLGFPLGCPPTQQMPVMPTPLPIPATGFNMIPATPIAMPIASPAATAITVLPGHVAPTPVVIQSLPTFR
jgi:hypothetical protein